VQNGRDSRRKEDLAFMSLHTLPTCSASFRDIFGFTCIAVQKVLEEKEDKIRRKDKERSGERESEWEAEDRERRRGRRGRRGNGRSGRRKRKERKRNEKERKKREEHTGRERGRMSAWARWCFGGTTTVCERGLSIFSRSLFVIKKEIGGDGEEKRKKNKGKKG
jgi:hypothetical protein